jgi:hypothetical protein
MMVLAKMLEAIGIAALAIGLVQGIYGNISFEYYTFFGGVLFFFAGRLLEKSILKRRAAKDGGHDQNLTPDGHPGA